MKVDLKQFLDYYKHQQGEIIMRDLPAILFGSLAACTFTFTANAQDNNFTVRPDPEGAKVTVLLDSMVTEKWTMASGEVGATPMRFHISADHTYHGVEYWFNTTIEMEFPEDVRQTVFDNLTNAFYSNVTITDRGVSYLIVSSTDLDLHSTLEGEGAADVKFQPHDCTRVTGECAFTKVRPGKETVYYIRTSTFSDGIWTDRLNYDPAKDPQGRSDLVVESRFSVDATGTTIDMEKKTYGGGKEYLTLLTRVYEKQKDVKQPDQPSLPDGNYASVGMSCTENSVMIQVGPARQSIAAGKRALIRNAGSKPIIECTSDVALETSCPSRGYVLVSFKNDFTALGCYKGNPPPNPWGQD